LIQGRRRTLAELLVKEAGEERKEKRKKRGRKH